MKKTITLEDFKTKYAELKAKHKEVKKMLKDVHKQAKSLAKDASKLYAAANNSLYFEDESGIHPVSSIIPSMMDSLDFWRTIDVELLV